jgi:hypothetical protein
MQSVQAEDFRDVLVRPHDDNRALGGIDAVRLVRVPVTVVVVLVVDEDLVRVAYPPLACARAEEGGDQGVVEGEEGGGKDEEGFDGAVWVSSLGGEAGDEGLEGGCELAFAC